MMATLETPRLVLRPFAPEDLEEFYAYAKNPAVGPLAGWRPHKNREETRGILENFIRGEEETVWAIVLRETGELIGSLGMHDDGARHGMRAKMMGYVLGEDWWGRGYAPEAARRVLQYAFEEQDVEVVSVAHFAHNTRSRRVIEKCGFCPEGTLRHAWRLFDGTVVDDVRYSMLREEYERDQKRTV